MAAFGSSSSPTGEKSKKQGHCLKPRLVLERSFVNSVTELVYNAIPNQSSASPSVDKIEWVSFADECDLSDPSIKSYLEKIVGPDLPIIIIIGYAYGYQIWALLSNGECEELLSLRNVPVNCVRFLPLPKLNAPDELASSRPLLAVCDDSGPQSFCSVNIVSLRQNGRSVRSLDYNDSIINILTSDRAIVVMFMDKIVVVNPVTFRDRFWIRNCFNKMNPNSAALSGCWLAYSDVTLNPTFQSCGGASSYDDSSYTSQVVTVAKNLSKTVSDIGASLATMTGVGGAVGHHHHHHHHHQRSNNRYPLIGTKKSESTDKVEGVVTILNVEEYNNSAEVDLHSVTESSGIIAHFLANAGDEPIVYLKFNNNGTLLLTSGPSGRTFDVFLILPHPSSPCLGAVQHLYVLQRGATVAKILDIVFAPDSRWVAVSTANGTTHVFPVTPYGGSISLRTHAGPKVVNRESRFHRSAGLESLENSVLSSAVHHSSSSSAIYSPLKPKEQHPSTINYPHGSLYRAASNPRLPPYAPPHVVLAASKIKQSHFGAGVVPLVDYYGSSVVSAASSAVPAALTGGGVSAAAAAARQSPISSAVSSAITSTAAQPGGGSNCVYYGSAADYYSSSCSGGKSAAAAARSPATLLMGATTTYRLMSATFAAGRGFKSVNSTPLRNDPYPDSLYIIRANGQLSEYQLTIKPYTVGPRVSEENPVELHVIPTVEWPLARCKADQETDFPLDNGNVLLEAAAIKHRLFYPPKESIIKCQKPSLDRDLWISQVEIVTYSGPHRRLWMGPQFTFKTYLDSQRSAPLVCPTLPLRVGSRHTQPVAIGGPGSASTPTSRLYNNKGGPGSGIGSSMHSIPVVIEASSTGSFDHVPPGPLMDVCGSWSENNDYITHAAYKDDDALEGKLRKNLAEAMADSTAAPQSPASASDTVSSDDLSIAENRRRYSSGRDSHQSDL